MSVCTHMCDYIGCAGSTMWTPGIQLHTIAHSTTQKHTLWLCGFLCGLSAHPDSDHPIPTSSTFPDAPQPSPGGSHSVTGHSCLQLWAGSQQLGLGLGDACDAEGRNPRRVFIKEDRRKSGCQMRGRKERIGVSRGYLSHTLSYTKFPSEAVILEASLKSKRLCADGDQTMVTH